MNTTKSIFVHAPYDSMHLQRMVRGAAQFAREQTPPWAVRWGYLPFDKDRLKPIEFDAVIFFALSNDERVAMERVAIPAVNVSSRNLPTRHPSVFADDDAIGRMAANHFTEALYKRFAFGGPLKHTYAHRRYQAFCEALKLTSLEVPNLLSDVDHPHLADTHARMLDQFRSLPKNTAVFAANDNFARQFCQLALEAGRAVPGDIAILGVDAEEMISFTSPVALSSIDPNSYRIGYEAARTIRCLFADAAPVPPVTFIPPKGLVVEASTDHLATSDPLIVRAVELIRLQGCQGLTIEDLCKTLAVSRRSLERRFRKAVNKSLNEQISKVRIDRARALLEKSELSIGEIAEQCGYASIYSFSRAFKEATGQSPRAFRTSG